MAVVCPECDNPLTVDTDEVEEGETVQCDECGTELEIVSVDPLELAPMDVTGYDDEEDTPALEEDDPRHPRHDPRYRELSPVEIPATECLKDTLARFLPCWHDRIAPVVCSGKRVLLAAHGNSLRALVKHFDEVSDADIVELNIPTGIPLIYELDNNLKAIRHYYLGDAQRVQKAMQAVASQASLKAQQEGSFGTIMSEMRGSHP